MDEITSVFALNGASTALVRNALREPGAPVYLALRYRAAYGPTYRGARILRSESPRGARLLPTNRRLVIKPARAITDSPLEGDGFEPIRGVVCSDTSLANTPSVTNTWAKLCPAPDSHDGVREEVCWIEELQLHEASERTDHRVRQIYEQNRAQQE
jgi:hypothetical protein